MPGPTGIATFLFDADCGVCQDGTDRMRSRIRPPVSFQPYQSSDLRALGVTEQECFEGPVLVRPDGSHAVGPGAIAGLLLSARRPYRFVGLAMNAPGIRQALDRIGPSLYRQRHRLPGATAACRVN